MKIDPFAHSDGRLERLFGALETLIYLDDGDDNYFEVLAVERAWLAMKEPNEEILGIHHHADGIEVRPTRGPIAEKVRAIAADMAIEFREADGIYLAGSNRMEFIERVMPALGGQVVLSM